MKFAPGDMNRSENDIPIASSVEFTDLCLLSLFPSVLLFFMILPILLPSFPLVRNMCIWMFILAFIWVSSSKALFPFYCYAVLLTHYMSFRTSISLLPSIVVHFLLFTLPFIFSCIFGSIYIHFLVQQFSFCLFRLCHLLFYCESYICSDLWLLVFWVHQLFCV